MHYSLRVTTMAMVMFISVGGDSDVDDDNDNEGYGFSDGYDVEQLTMIVQLIVIMSIIM